MLFHIKRSSKPRSYSRSGEGEGTEENSEKQPAIDVPSQRGLWLYLSVPILSILLCGSKEPWALGMYACLIGITALLATPRRKVPLRVTLPLAGGLALCLAAFLPVSWFSMPAWREGLQRDFGVQMGSTLSPQTWISFESWMALAVSAVWLIFCMGRGYSAKERRLTMRVLTLFSAVLSCAALVVNYMDIHIPFWKGMPGLFYLGPFPNRNHFSGLLVITVVLALATTHDAYRQKHRSWPLYLVCIAPMFLAILSNTSRMGVVLLFIGTAAWMFTASLRREWAARAAILVAVLLVMATIVMLFGSQIVQRLIGGKEGMMSTLAKDARWQLFSDTAGMISQSPWFGVGLGNFEPVFALHRTVGELHSRPLHPENDWLWFGAEAGLPSLVLALVAAGGIISLLSFRKHHDSRGRRDRRLRSAAGLGVVLMLLQGILNTPMHAPGFVAFISLLAGLALAPRRAPGKDEQSEEIYPPLYPWIYRFLGLCALACGTIWFASIKDNLPICGNSFYRRQAREANELTQRGDYAGALVLWNMAAAIKPLQWNIYYERAMLKLRLGMPAGDALRDFGCWRQLERRNALLCMREYEYWQYYKPVNGIPAMREAMRRDPLSVNFNYEMRLSGMLTAPELRPHFYAMAESDPKLTLAYLPFATPTEFSRLIERILASYPTLAMYSKKEQQRLFKVWYEKGDQEQLIRLLQENLEWRTQGWRVLAEHKAKSGDFRAAYELVLSSVPSPTKIIASSDVKLEQLEKAFTANPTDLAAGIRLYETQRTQMHLDEALITIAEVVKLPEAPPRVFHERAALMARKEDYEGAWKAISEYVKRMESAGKEL